MSSSKFSTPIDISRLPPRKRIERSRMSNSSPTIKKSVAFSSSVSMRCFFYDGPLDGSAADNASTSPSSLWLRKDEVDKIKSRAKTLAKLHHHVRAKKGTKAKKTVTIVDATRYEIRGESLRGMEHLTDIANRRKRRRIQAEAIHAAVVEQQEQLIQHVIESVSSTSCSLLAVEDQVKSRALQMDTSKLAKAYGTKTQEALVYAKSVAEEDANIAAEILAEDLKASPSRKCCSIKKADSSNSVAAEMIKSFLPRTMSRQRNLVSAQA